MNGTTMLLPPDQRRLLGSFLRRRREDMMPEASAWAKRRRTPGLRREDVAQRCGLSTTWYTWVEQGRDIALSAEALARLADALHLSAAERAYLFELARRRDPAPPDDAAAAALSSGLLETVQAIAVPAYLLDPLWHVRAWNEAAAHLFAPWFDSGEPCLLRYVFLGATAPAFISDWSDRARRLLAEFRADTAHRADDPAVQALVADLTRRSPLFAEAWASHTVLAREGGTRAFEHPRDGRLCFEQVTFVPARESEHKLVMLMPR